MAQDNIDRIFQLIEPIVQEEQCELLDVEFTSDQGHKVLRVTIDKTGGVLVADCSRVSHSIEDLLEVENVVPGHFNLEVSSPGLNRPLRLKKHFERVLGQKIQVTTKEKIEGRKHYKGILRQIKSDDLVIEIDNQEFKVPFKQLAKANLVYEKQ